MGSATEFDVTERLVTISSGQWRSRSQKRGRAWEISQYFPNKSHRVLQVLKLNKSNQVMLKNSLKKLKPHFSQRMRFVILTHNVEFSTTLSSFCASKLWVPTTFHADNCSSGIIVHYADKSHYSCGRWSPTFEKSLFVWRLCLQRWQRRFLEDQVKTS